MMGGVVAQVTALSSDVMLCMPTPMLASFRTSIGDQVIVFDVVSDGVSGVGSPCRALEKTGDFFWLLNGKLQVLGGSF